MRNFFSFLATPLSIIIYVENENQVIYLGGFPGYKILSLPFRKHVFVETNLTMLAWLENIQERELQIYMYTCNSSYIVYNKCKLSQKHGLNYIELTRIVILIKSC